MAAPDPPPSAATKPPETPQDRPVASPIPGPPSPAATSPSASGPAGAREPVRGTPPLPGPDMARLHVLRGWRPPPRAGVSLADAMASTRAALAKARRGRAAVLPARGAVPPALLSMAELLPIEHGTLRIRPLHASARAAWSAWLRDGGEHALVRSSKGAFTRVRLVVGARTRTSERPRTPRPGWRDTSRGAR